MRVTAENWKEIEEHLRRVGIADAFYDADDWIETVTTKDGQQYEFTHEIIKELIAKGLMIVKRGVRVDPKE